MSALTGYRSHPAVPDSEQAAPMVWAWIGGRWEEAHVQAQGHDSDGWRWLWVAYRGGSCWVLQARTAERTLSPAEVDAHRLRVEQHQAQTS